MVTRLQTGGKSSFGQVNTTTAFLCGAMRLTAQQDLLDKTQLVVLGSMKTLDKSFLKDIEELFSDTERKRKCKSENIKQQLLIVVQGLKELKLAVCSDEKIMQLDVNSYRNSLFDLESRITSLKEFIGKEYVQLGSEESVLWEQMCTVEHKIDEWNKPVRATALLAQPHPSTSSKTFCPGAHEAVTTLQRFLHETGGHSGGWVEDDHLQFLRLRRKYQNKNSFMESLLKELPDMSREDILNHEDWFVQYEILKARQRLAIEQWRINKGKTKGQEVTAKESIETIKSSKPASKESIAETKQKIQEWKREKQLQKEKEEVEKSEEKKKQLADWERKKTKQEAQRVELERYKEKKINHHQAFLLARQLCDMEEIEARTAQANLNLKAFREQDQEFMARQKSRRAQKLQEQTERQRSLACLKQQVQVTAERDPQRLLRPTEVWRQRLRTQSLEDSANPKPVLDVRNMPRLGIPAWRKGLT